MTENFKTALVGVTGIAGTEVIPELANQAVIGSIHPTVNLVLQIVIGIVTLVKLLKKNKKKDEQTTDKELQQ